MDENAPLASENWEEFVDLHYRGVYAFCSQFLRSRDEGGDATQETFMKAWQSRESDGAKAYPRQWIYRIARNVCIDRTRWWKRFKLFQDTYHRDGQVESSATLGLLLRTLVSDLPLRQREVFILRHWHGFSTEETAGILGIQPGSVKSHLARAIMRLKHTIADEEAILETAKERT